MSSFDTNNDLGEFTTGDEEVQENTSQGSDAVKVLEGLLADPVVAAAVQARAEGREVNIVPKEEQEDTQEEVAEDPKGDLSDLDENTQQLIALFDQRLGPLRDKIEALEGVAGAYQEQEVNGAIEKAQKKFTDFDKYRKAMVKLTETTSGLSVEELYLLAKARSGDLKPESPSTDSELPTPASRRRRLDTQRKKDEVPRGRKGWNEILAKGLSANT